MNFEHSVIRLQFSSYLVPLSLYCERHLPVIRKVRAFFLGFKSFCCSYAVRGLDSSAPNPSRSCDRITINTTRESRNFSPIGSLHSLACWPSTCRNVSTAYRWECRSARSFPALPIFNGAAWTSTAFSTFSTSTFHACTPLPPSPPRNKTPQLPGPPTSPLRRRPTRRTRGAHPPVTLLLQPLRLSPPIRATARSWGRSPSTSMRLRSFTAWVSPSGSFDRPSQSHPP